MYLVSFTVGKGGVWRVAAMTTGSGESVTSKWVSKAGLGSCLFRHAEVAMPPDSSSALQNM